ncbi:hypothetical protein HMPREF2939_00430 [Achromobacter xylosoxidans]|nr:hypothetical protein HMPREF2939_00430 [Achromobacter xylosoxidans]
MLIQIARDDEQQVGKSIQILAYRWVDAVRARQGDNRALGAPADRASHVRVRGGGGTTGQYEFPQRGQGRVVVRQPGVQVGDLFVIEGRMTRDAELCTHVEQIMLHRQQVFQDLRGQRVREHNADSTIQFIHIA